MMTWNVRTRKTGDCLITAQLHVWPESTRTRGHVELRTRVLSDAASRWGLDDAARPRSSWYGRKKLLFCLKFPQVKLRSRLSPHLFIQIDSVFSFFLTSSQIKCEWSYTVVLSVGTCAVFYCLVNQLAFVDRSKSWVEPCRKYIKRLTA